MRIWPQGTSDLAARVRALDWAQTSLGPLADWPERVRAVVDLVLASPVVASVALGSERRLIYNDAAARLYGDRHPAALGLPLAAAFPDSYPRVAGFYDRVFAGESVCVAAQPLVIDGQDEVFDAYLTPVRDEAGAVIGAHMVGLEIGELVRAEAALREREAHLIRMQRIGRVGSLDIDVAGGLVSRRSAEFLRLHGLAPDQAEETHAQWRARVHPDDVAGAEQRLFDALAGTGSEYDNEYRIIRPSDGAVRWIHARVDIERDAAGQATRLVGAHLDVTVQKQLQERLRESDEQKAFLLKLSDALRPLQDSIALERTAVEMLGRELRASRVFYATLDQSEDSWSVAHDYHCDAPSNAGHYPLSAFQRARLAGWRAGRTSSVADSETDPGLNDAERAVYRDMGARAAIGVPLVSAGRLVAMLAVNQTEPRDWTAAEVALVRETAERTWTAIEYARAETALKHSEAKYRSLFETMGQGFAEFELIRAPDGRVIDLRFLELNPAYERLTGISADETRGRTAREINPGFDDWWLAAYGRIIEAGRPERLEHEVRTLERWFEAHVYPRGGDRAAALYEDITDRKRTEAAAALLAGITEDLARLTTPDEIVAAAGDRMGQALDLNLCLFADVDEDRAEVVVHHAWQRKGAPDLRHQTFRIPDFLSEEFARSQRAGETIVVRDVANDERTDAAACARLSVRAILAVPFHRQGRWLAYLTVTDAAPRDWRPDEIATVREVAERVFPRIERARAEAAIRESEERYRALFESMDEAYAVVEVLKDAAGSWCDFRFVEVNPAFMVHTNMPYPVGQTATELLGTPNPRWTELYGQALDTGDTLRVEESEGTLGITFDLNIFALDRARDRVAVLFTNITDRKQAEVALRASEEAQRLTVELVPALLWSASADGREIVLNEGWTAYTGQTEPETRNFGWLGAIHPDDLPETRAAFEQAFATGEPIERQQRIHKVGNGYRWHLVRHVPIRDAEGRIARWFGAAVDIHDSKLAEQALDASERRLQTLVEGVPQLVWRASDPGFWTWASPQWTAYTGQSEADSHAWGWLEPVHPDDRDRVRRIWSGAIERGEFHAEYRLCHAAEGRYRWFQTRATPVRDLQNRIVEWLGTSTDVDDLRRLQDRQQLLVAELQHRTRNLMGVVRAMADRTGESATGFADFRERFRDRLDALARVQGLLSRLADADRIAFDELIRTEIAAMNASGNRVTLTGPLGIRLRSSMVQTLAMALHELATNAVKYGALGQPDGRLAISWRMVEPDRRGRPRLRIDWRESGVRMPPAGTGPRDGGHGRELIERALPYQLGAEATFELRPDGVRCTIVIPVSTSTAEERTHDRRDVA